jgi:spore coat-associated protein N
MSTPHPADNRRRMRWGRLAAAFVLFTGTAISAQYASASFGDPSTVSQAQVAAGTLAITLGDGDAAQVFQTFLPDFYPGRTDMRLLEITIGGTADLKTLSVVPSDSCGGCVSSLLTNDATNGLGVGIERCTAAWSASGSAPYKTYSCADGGNGDRGGTKMLTDQLTPFDTLNDTEVTLSTGLSSFSVGTTYHYLFYFQLPASTSSSTLGKASAATFTFKGTQRDAAAK